MTSPESPPGFVVRTEAEKAASDNGFRIERDVDGPWIAFASTTVHAQVWIAGVSPGGPWFLSINHPGVVAELQSLPASPVVGPGHATYQLATLNDLHAALDRTYKLALSLPNAPLERFRKESAGLPRNTEAERMVVARVGQKIFREALMDYWSARCPLTGIADAALLRASHIIPWSESDDEARLDVHNGFLLAAHWDAAFDAFLVSFTDDGEPIVSPALSTEARTALRLDNSPRLEGLTADHWRNLAWHRERLAWTASQKRYQAD